MSLVTIQSVTRRVVDNIADVETTPPGLDTLKAVLVIDGVVYESSTLVTALHWSDRTPYEIARRYGIAGRKSIVSIAAPPKEAS